MRTVDLTAPTHGAAIAYARNVLGLSRMPMKRAVTCLNDNDGEGNMYRATMVENDVVTYSLITGKPCKLNYIEDAEGTHSARTVLLDSVVRAFYEAFKVDNENLEEAVLEALIIQAPEEDQINILKLLPTKPVYSKMLKAASERYPGLDNFIVKHIDMQARKSHFKGPRLANCA